jgi:hypothetical protein
MYAGIATKASGDEFLPGAEVDNGTIVPMIGADREQGELYRELALMLRKHTGASVRLCRFELVEELEEI